MNYTDLVREVTDLHASAQAEAGRAVNQLLTLRNWLWGAYIFEYEQAGADRAAYGKGLLQQLAADLTGAGLRGAQHRNLKWFRQFALAYPELATIGNPAGSQLLASASRAIGIPPGSQFPRLQARAKPGPPWRTPAVVADLFAHLSWSHFRRLLQLDAPELRYFYEAQCLKNRWSSRELRRQIDSHLAERTIQSGDIAGYLRSLDLAEAAPPSAPAVLKDPYVLEFLGLPAPPAHTESELEQRLMDHLQTFLLELGPDFCFVGRQHRLTVDDIH